MFLSRQRDGFLLSAPMFNPFNMKPLIFFLLISPLSADWKLGGSVTSTWKIGTGLSGQLQSLFLPSLPSPPVQTPAIFSGVLWVGRD